MQIRCVDFFSGLGGFSKAFLDRGHNVVRIDNDPKFAKVPKTMIADIFTLDPEDLPQQPDILLMSPPCNCFSVASISHYWENGRPKNEKTLAAIALVERALWLKDQIKPKWWILENPVGMLIHVLGPPIEKTWWAAWFSDKDTIVKELGGKPLKPTYLWGKIPSIDWPVRPTEYIRAASGSKNGIQNSSISPALRAMIPYEFGKALCLSIEQERGGQLSILDF